MTKQPWFLLPADAPIALPTAPIATRAVPPVDRREVARFQREQPPQTIPPRSRPPTVPGLVAAAVLGQRVIRRF